jgi:pSer/pThr/pTyr-binding forkhead associated (FHA) protein
VNPPRKAFLAEFVVLSGESEGRRVPLLSDNILIGRSPRCDIQIPDRSISREHARIRYYEGRWFIQDQQSAAGIIVNGKKMLAGPLQDGDIIQLGETRLRFSAG